MSITGMRYEVTAVMHRTGVQACYVIRPDKRTAKPEARLRLKHKHSTLELQRLAAPEYAPRYTLCTVHPTWNTLAWTKEDAPWFLGYLVSSSSSSSIATTAHCGLWPVEQCPSMFSYLPPTLSIFSLPALEDLFLLPLSIFSIQKYNNNIYLLQLGCHPVAVVILHVNKTWNRLLLNLSREGYMRSM